MNVIKVIHAKWPEKRVHKSRSMWQRGVYVIIILRIYSNLLNQQFAFAVALDQQQQQQQFNIYAHAILILISNLAFFPLFNYSLHY